MKNWITLFKRSGGGLLRNEPCFLISTSNDGHIYSYGFNKTERFGELFKEFLLRLGFDKKEVGKVFLTYDEDDKEFREQISLIEDTMRFHTNKEFGIEVFYGNKTILVIVRTKKREKLLGVVDKLFKFRLEFEK